MAATGKTPILLYGSTTSTNTPAAGNLTNSSDGCEIAINVADKNLFFKDSTNIVNTVPIRQSSASSNGWLSSTDWSTFNGKAPAFTYTTGYIPFGQGTTTPTQSSNLFWDNSNVRLGVGTSSPAKTLDVNGAANINGALTIAGNFLVPSGCTIYASTGDVYARAGTSGNLYLGANGSNSLATLFASGGVSIGNTTDPGAANLSVSGIGYFGTTSGQPYGNSNSELVAYQPTSTNSGSAAFIGTAYSGDVGNAAVFFSKYDNNSTTSQIFAKFLINNTASACGLISANGAGFVTFGGWSDERLKENIIDLPSQLQNINNLRPVEFDYKDGSGHQLGFIAQEFQKVYPDCVNAGSDGMLMLSGWSKTEARLVKALQELSSQVTDMQNKLKLAGVAGF